MKVINGRKDGWIGEHVIYIGRANPRLKLKASPLANPFRIGKDGDRATVISKYRQWLDQKIEEGDRTVLDELEEIRERVENGDRIQLACYCAPRACHGDVICDRIIESLRSTRNS